MFGARWCTCAAIAHANRSPRARAGAPSGGQVGGAFFDAAIHFRHHNVAPPAPMSLPEDGQIKLNESSRASK